MEFETSAKDVQNWTEDEFTVTVSPGIRNRDVRVAEIVTRELEKTKPDKWRFVVWEEVQVGYL
jgi:hypothetical protein